MLDDEHEQYLRALCGDTIPEEDIQKLVQELTIEEFWRRVNRLQRNIVNAKREHYLERRRPFRGRRP